MEVHLTPEPLLPGLSWIDHWVGVHFPFFNEEFSHVVRIHLLLQILDKHVVVDISVIECPPQGFIVQEILEFLILHLLVDHQSSLIEPSENGILNGQQATPTSMFSIGSHGQQVANSFEMISLSRPHQGRLPILSQDVHIGLVLLDQQLTDFSAAEDGCTMQRGGLVVDSQRLIDELWFVLEDPFYFIDFSAFDVVEEILVPGVAMGDALDGASYSHVV